MLFSSLDFAVFLPIVFILYWFVFNKSIKLQNLLILVASYVFYGWWDWRFLSLILFSSIVDFLIGIKLSEETRPSPRKLWLMVSLLVNLGLLGVFKYYNFFLDNFIEVFSLFGYNLNVRGLELVLPVGISFYTFQTLSYSIDVYRGKLMHTRDFIAFSAFVSFFPQLVAGPIERAKNLLPQFSKVRVFGYAQATDGLRQILWGLFKKVVIADNCASHVNLIFSDINACSSWQLFVGALLFAFQIYGDFSGYSDIAIGTGRLFDFNLKRNFAYPYFSRSISEFWRRWHISLSTWFRDYLYIPLGGSQVGLAKKIRNVFIIFIVSGFWHGANWTFIFWGALNAIYFLPELITKKNRRHLEIVASTSVLPRGLELLQILKTFILCILAWVAFRAENMNSAFDYYAGLFQFRLNSAVNLNLEQLPFTISLMLVVEWLGRNEEHGMVIIEKIRSGWGRWSLYLVLVMCVYLLGQFGSAYEFIYFQF